MQAHCVSIMTRWPVKQIEWLKVIVGKITQKETLPDWTEPGYKASDAETDPEFRKKIAKCLKKLRGGKQ